MKALFIDSPGRVVVKEVERPSPGRGEVLVEMMCCGICGTDLEKVRGDSVTPPVLGHEVVGRVSSLGEGVTGLRAGDRVFTHHHAPCYECEACRRAEYTVCAEFPKHNIRPGGFADYYVVPEWNVSRGAVFRLPDALSYEQGSFIEPLGCCIRGLSKIEFEGHTSAIIYGAGPVGLLHLMLLQHHGYRDIAVADPSGYRLSFAEKLGAETFDPRDSRERKSALEVFDGMGPEVGILATGNPVAFQDALSTVSSGGKILLFGSPPRDSVVSLDLPSYFLRGVSVIPSYSTSEKETNLASKLLSSGEMDVSRLVTHRFKLNEASTAFRIADEQRCIKAIISP